MPNPGGTNQFGTDPAYGDVKRLTELTREAPMSGARVAAGATNAPRRAQRQVTRPARPAAAAPQAAQAPPAPVSYEAQLAAVWAQVAADPGASPLVREYAQQAQGA